MNILITGASGFTGSYMIRFLTTLGNVNITGLARRENSTLFQAPHVSWCFGDLLNRDELFAAVSSSNPDIVLHLAGLTRGPLTELRAVNVDGTRNLLDAVIMNNPVCPIVIVSSSAVYGYAGTAPIRESQTLKPVSDYGMSKVEQEAICHKYMRSELSSIAIARPFNLVGPGQPDSFVCAKIIRQVVEIGQGKRDALDLLETDSFRDFIDVRDVVQGYWALLSHPEFKRTCAGKIFNIGSGEPNSIADVIRILEEITGDPLPIRLPQKPVPVPVPYQRSDNHQIFKATGLKPGIPISVSLRDMLTVARGHAGLP